MVASGVRGIDLFKIAGRSISGWLPSLKTGLLGHIRQPFCSQLELRLLLFLEYHPQAAWYVRGDIDAQFATTYRLLTPAHAPFTVGYAFESKRTRRGGKPKLKQQPVGEPASEQGV